MAFNPFKFLKYHLYLFQLENYEIKRYLYLIYRRRYTLKDQRQKLVWTPKAILLFGIALVLSLACAGLALVTFSSPWKYLIFIFYFIIFSNLLPPLFLIIASIIIWPVGIIAKQIIVARARSKIRNLSGIKIIGIAGSYGKTTMKEVLKQVLSAKCLVLSTPDSVNTPVGIARWILKHVDGKTEIIIVEMGEHYRGDVEDLCKITRPDIAVVTGINEAHLERMGSLENVTATIFEIVANAKPGATIVLNADDKNVMENYKKFIWPDHKIEKFSIHNFQFSKFDAEKLVWKVRDESIGDLEINLLGEYALGDVDAAIKIGRELGMAGEEIKKGIAQIKPVEHRLQPIKSANDILIIDDSYNGNPDGAAEAIKVLSRFEGRRKIYITPGLVEMGKSAPNVHREVGRQLARVADVVILIKNSVTQFVAEGMSENRRIGESEPKIIWFGTAQEAHAGLKGILKPNDVILFQNDWGDNYW